MNNSLAEGRIFQKNEKMLHGFGGGLTEAFFRGFLAHRWDGMAVLRSGGRQMQEEFSKSKQKSDQLLLEVGVWGNYCHQTWHKAFN
jgi:hypothetical protein